MRKIVEAALAGFITAVFVGIYALPAADFDGDSRTDLAIFRPSTGLWAVRGVTRVYFGANGDIITPGDYNGDELDDIAIFRESNGLWAVRGVTRAYFGGTGDTPVVGGGGQRTYDYVVKAGDGDDLVRALESDTYKSVFIPNGTYEVSEIITVDNLSRVTGESMGYTVILFTADGYYLDINQDCCLLEDFSVGGGGSTSADVGAIHIREDLVEVRNVRSFLSNSHGFSYTGDAGSDISFFQARAMLAASTGFSGDIDVETTFTNCRAINCENGFHCCRNLSSCVVRWDDMLERAGAAVPLPPGPREEIITHYGFILCDGLSSCRAINCSISGFWLCRYVSASSVDGGGSGTYGFGLCSNLSSCHVKGTTDDEYYDSVCCVDGDSCD